MRLRSFYAASSTEAMRLVREALGEDAIIISTRDDEEKGGVRVTAAIDDPVTPPQSQAFVPARFDADEDDSGSASLDFIAQLFVQHALPRSLSERLMATATQYASEDTFLALGAALDTHFKFAPFSEDLSRPRVLIGPPGAGKTLCTAKLATAAALAQKPVALISTDTQRAGGMAQLQAFARVLQTQIMEIEDPHALHDAIAMQKAGTLILIDTAGCNPFNASERDELATLLKIAKGENILVMPSDMEALQALDMTKEFQALDVNCLLPTRLDMTRRLGSLLHVAYETHVPLSVFSASAKVTEAMQPLNPVSLARLLYPVQEQEQQTQTAAAV